LCRAVWDSSIVMAKYFERWADKYAGLRCLDLSAGCGLVGASHVVAVAADCWIRSQDTV
jgi:predicted nicotinamide N-methyase